MISNRSLFSNPEQRVLLAAHIARQLPGDHQLFCDDLMVSVLQGQQRFTRQQFNALMASPLTLCRLRFLEGRRLAQQGRHQGQAEPAKPQLLPLNRWRPSVTHLKAAAPLGQDFSLSSADGRWALHSLTTGQVTRLVLQLRAGVDDNAPGLGLGPGTMVKVMDGEGGILLLGRLDDDGELKGVWTRSVSLLTHLADCGGTLWVGPPEETM